VGDRTAPQERTALAWRRTGLALVVGALTIGRLGLDHLGSVVVVPTVVAASLAGWVLVAAVRERRPVRGLADGSAEGSTDGLADRFADGSVDGPQFSVLTDGRLPAVVATLVGGLAAGELLAALASLV
jgi:putative membrane protein